MSIIVRNRAGAFRLSLAQWDDGSVSLVQEDRANGRRAVITISQDGDLVVHGELPMDEGLRVDPETGQPRIVTGEELEAPDIPETLKRAERPRIISRDGVEELPVRESGLTEENEPKREPVPDVPTRRTRG